jgi:hypothetical protein
VGQLVPDGEDLGELLLILHHQNISAAVGQHVLTRLRRVGGIDAGGEAAGEHAAQVREEPLRTVEADDADAVARLQAQLDEGLGKKEYCTSQLTKKVQFYIRNSRKKCSFYSGVPFKRCCESGPSSGSRFMNLMSEIVKNLQL